MTSKVLNNLFMFQLQGSGRILRKVNKMEIKIAAFEPVHASSYIALPGFLNGCWFLPTFLYFATESYLIPIAKAQPSPSTSYTVAIETHETCGYAIADIEHGKATPLYFELNRGGNCLIEFVKSLYVLARDIYNRERAF